MARTVSFLPPFTGVNFMGSHKIPISGPTICSQNTLIFVIVGADFGTTFLSTLFAALPTVPVSGAIGFPRRYLSRTLALASSRGSWIENFVIPKPYSLLAAAFNPVQSSYRLVLAIYPHLVAEEA